MVSLNPLRLLERRILRTRSTLTETAAGGGMFFDHPQPRGTLTAHRRDGEGGDNGRGAEIEGAAAGQSHKGRDGEGGDTGRDAEVEGAATGQSRVGRDGEGCDHGRDADVNNRGGRVGWARCRGLGRRVRWRPRLARGLGRRVWWRGVLARGLRRRQARVRRVRGPGPFHWRSAL